MEKVSNDAFMQLALAESLFIALAFAAISMVFGWWIWRLYKNNGVLKRSLAEAERRERRFEKTQKALSVGHGW